MFFFSFCSTKRNPAVLGKELPAEDGRTSASQVFKCLHTEEVPATRILPWTDVRVRNMLILYVSLALFISLTYLNYDICHILKLHTLTKITWEQRHLNFTFMLFTLPKVLSHALLLRSLTTTYEKQQL